MHQDITRPHFLTLRHLSIQAVFLASRVRANHVAVEPDAFVVLIPVEPVASRFRLGHLLESVDPVDPSNETRAIALLHTGKRSRIRGMASTLTELVGPLPDKGVSTFQTVGETEIYIVRFSSQFASPGNGG